MRSLTMDHIIKQLEEAFRVRHWFRGTLTLLPTSHPDRKVAEALLLGKRWDEVNNSALAREYVIPSILTEEAFRVFLPAMMVAGFSQPISLEFLDFFFLQFDSGGSGEAPRSGTLTYPRLTNEQRDVVRLYFSYWQQRRDLPGIRFAAQSILKTLPRE
jgi:hypothetical protein